MWGERAEGVVARPRIGTRTIAALIVGAVAAMGLMAVGVTPASAEGRCLAGWDELAPQAETADELQYMDEIVICNERATGAIVMINQSDMVWSFADAYDGDIELEFASMESQAFHAMTDDRNMAVLPYMAPDDQVRILNTRAFRWVVDGWLTVAWEGMNELYKAIERKSVGALEAAIVAKSLTRRALWRCGGALGAFLDSNSSAPSEISGRELLARMGLAKDASACAKAWKKAAAKNKTWFPSWGNQVIATEKYANVAKRLSGSIDEADRIARLFCGFIPRC